MPDYEGTSHQIWEWQTPPAAVKESEIIGWLNSATEEGQAWLKSQRGYADFQKSLDVISGKDTRTTPAEYRSKLSPNRLKRNLREVVGTLARLRPMWGYHSDNLAYAAQAEFFNKVTKAWYLETFADRKIREALQYASATCRGWVHPIYTRDMYGTGRGDIKLESYGSPCVLPVQLPGSGDWQSAYAITILKEMPVAMAHGMFPSHQHRIRPSESRYWYQNDAVRRATTGNVLQRIFGKGSRRPDAGALSDLLVPIRYTWVIDLTINTTKMEIPMGEDGASWAYRVPYVGQSIPTGNDSRSGAPTFRTATENDARLYPYRRLLISTDSVLLYDGPSFDWHGMFPGVSFCVDDWPWEPLGFSLVHEGFEINESVKSIARGIMDKIAAQLRPSLAFDTNAVSMSEARALDPFQPDKRVGYDGNASDAPPFQPVLPPEALKVEDAYFKMIEYLEGALDTQLGVRDAMALAKLRTVGSMDDLEKIVEANGPIIADISRSMEPPMRDLGVMVKYLITQWYTTPRAMQIVGAENIPPETFDYHPSKITPSHLSGEDPERPSTYSDRERARIFADNLRFLITPNSLHELSQMVMKLGLIQLKKAGAKISSETLAEAWSVPNYGTFGGSTEIEKWQNEQEQDLEFAARMKALAGAEGLLPPPGAGGPGGPGAGGKPEGRPPSGQAAPALKQKDNGTRSTITESK